MPIEIDAPKPTFKANWHTHTYRCKHATGEVDDYCRAALDAGLETLGFSDHQPLPDNLWIAVRMSPEELTGYREAIADAQGRFPALRIYPGLECEYIKSLGGYYREELLGRHNLAYLVGAVHSIPYRGEWVSIHARATPNDRHALAAYADHLIELMSTGLFAYIAHPDVFGMFYDCWDAETEAVSRAIVAAARDCRLPLEINAYGLRKPPMETSEGTRSMYPWEPFWKIAAESGATAIVNSDAHKPEDIVGKVDEALALAERTGIRVIDDLALAE